ncbi:MAG: adenosylmethionine--8-amino-7-oxononanoate transaminase [Flavobacteriales bacterium]|nr:adenosylmethionine--8-amino-7-oxononanoate transaminase [Flavobacteriales bacterium]
MESESLSERDARVLFHPFTVFNPLHRNLVAERGEKEFLITADGRKIIDAVSSWWLNLHGHNHSYINQKIKQQIDTLEHVIFAGFTHAPAVHLAERLLGLGGEDYAKVFLSDNGSTSVEVALKMAIQASVIRGEGRKDVIAFKNAYHGDTLGAMSVSERDLFVKPFREHLFPVDYIDVPDNQNRESVFEQFEMLCKTKPAAFIFEPLVQGAGGMRMYAAEDLDKLIEIAQKHGVLCIADEVMTGFGRTGSLLASHQLTHSPDFICLSKGLTGGYLPLGATLISGEVAVCFETGDPEKAFYHGHSFTGNPISCTAALASLDLLESDSTRVQLEHINQIFSHWKESFSTLPFVSDARCKGGIFAFDFNTHSEGYFYTDPIKQKLYEYFLSKDILIRPMGNVVYVMPPYCISDDSLQKIEKAILDILF